MTQGRRTCLSCGAVDQAVGAVCPSCGPTIGIFVGSESSSSLACARCQIEVRSHAGIHPAATCAACGGRAFGWRDATGEWLITPIKEDSGRSGQWVRVDFDGAYQGTDPTASGAAHVETRAFAVTLLDGVFSNAAYVDAPPSLSRSDQEPPIREPAVSGVLMFDAPPSGASDAVAHPGGPFYVTLTDFRLHDWRHVSEETSIGRLIGTHGRLKGTGYGRLDLSTEPQKPRPHGSGPGGEAHTVKSLADRVNDVAERAAARTQSLLPPTLRADPSVERDCPTCGRTWPLVIALLVWLLCSWRAALVAGITLRFACAIQSRFCRWGIGFHGTRRPWRTILNILIGLVAIGIAVFALQRATTAAPFAACGRWLFPGYGRFLLAFLLTGLIAARWPRRVVASLFVWALLATCLSAERSCNVPGGAGVGGFPGTTMPGMPAMPPLSLPAQLAQSLSSIAGGLASDVTAVASPDETATLLQGLPAGVGGGLTLTSVSQARQNPDRYLECFPDSSGRWGPKHSIYLGYDAFFDYNSDRLKPEAAEASLRELLEVFNARPAARFVITGHADTTGSDAYNLSLSRRRAQAVADWLIQRGGVASERIEVVGAGESTPLIRPAAPVEQGGYLANAVQTVLPSGFINRINRRVEVTVDCPAPGSRP